MDKKDRINTFQSASSHGMALMAVDTDKNGNITKWMVENSWGMKGFKGHLIISDEWFDEYVFRLVIHKKYLTEEVLKVLEQKPVKLPQWDIMF
jgi:bleomycin hydrolase